MAWPGSLTAEQQEIVKTFVREQIRASILKLVAAANECKNTFDTYWGQIEDIIDTELSDTDIIPDGTGLAGAESLTKAEIVSLMTEITEMGDPSASTFPMNSQARRNKYVQAIGGTNMDA